MKTPSIPTHLDQQAISVTAVAAGRLVQDVDLEFHIPFGGLVLSGGFGCLAAAIAVAHFARRREYE